MRAPLALVAALLLPALSAPVTPQDSRPAGRLALTGLDADAPLAVTATATPARLTLQVKLQPGWHLYGRDTGGGQPVALELLAGSCFAADGAFKPPMNDQGEITGDAELTLPLRRVAAGERLKARFSFMVCDALQCLPPMEVLLSGDVGQAQAAPAGPKVLLVAMAKDARAARIEQFLGQRGFQPTVATYATVTKEQCDAHDVVLADSPYFKQASAARKDAMRFPETATPMVAVGFLGTVVLVAQKVTMACGYI